MDFEVIWKRILQFEGEEFITRGKKISFTYRIEGNSVVPNHTNYPLHKSQFIKAYNFGELNSTAKINKIVRGPSYILAILTDPRIQ